MSVQKAHFKRLPARLRRDKKGERPIIWAILAFIWTSAALFIGNNRPTIDSTLSQSSLSPDAQQLALKVLAGFLTVSAIILCYHLARAILRAPRYYNSGAIVVGFSLGVAAHVTPPETYQRAFNMLSPEAQTMVQDAAQSVQNADITAELLGPLRAPARSLVQQVTATPADKTQDPFISRHRFDTFAARLKPFAL